MLPSIALNGSGLWPASCQGELPADEKNPTIRSVASTSQDWTPLAEKTNFKTRVGFELTPGETPGEMPGTPVPSNSATNSSTWATPSSTDGRMKGGGAPGGRFRIVRGGGSRVAIRQIRIPQ